MARGGFGRGHGPTYTCASREQRLWAILYTRYGAEVRRFLAAYVNCSQDVDDLVQDVFIRLVKRRRIPKRPRVYIQVVARNCLRSYWRQKRKERELLGGQAASILRDDVIANPMLSERDSDPLEQLSNKEAEQLVKCAITHLPPELAQVLQLKIVEGLSLEEVARAVHCSPDALKKRLRRAKRRLLESYRRATEQEGHHLN